MDPYPYLLNFSANTTSTTPLQQSIVVQDLGGASMPFTTTTQFGSPWLTVTPTSGTSSITAPGFVSVIVNASGLTAGLYRDVVIISSPAATCPPPPPLPPGATVDCAISGGQAVSQIPIAFFVANTGPILSVTPTGVLFNVVQGVGSPATQNIVIANKGSANTLVEWSAGPVNGTNVPNAAFLDGGPAMGW